MLTSQIPDEVTVYHIRHPMFPLLGVVRGRRHNIAAFTHTYVCDTCTLFRGRAIER
jgi:hypothetical protein